MAAKNDFKNAIKAGGLNGRKPLTPSDPTVPMGYSAVREELEKQAEKLTTIFVPIIKLYDNPYQRLARPDLDEKALEELVASIETNGFYGALLARPRPRPRPTSRQRVGTGPATSRPTTPGNSDSDPNSPDQRYQPEQEGQGEEYELAYGHRRKEAARRAGLVELPVKIMPLEDAEMLNIMASENFSREDLDPLGEANVVGAMEATFNLSIREIARRIGKDRGWVERRLTLYKAPDVLKEMVARRSDTFSLVELLLAEKPERQATLVEQVLEEGLTRREVMERLGKNRLRSKNQPESDQEVETAVSPTPTNSSSPLSAAASALSSKQAGENQKAASQQEGGTAAANFNVSRDNLSPASWGNPDHPPIVTNFTGVAQRVNSEIYNNQDNAKGEARDNPGKTEWKKAFANLRVAADELIEIHNSMNNSKKEEGEGEREGGKEEKSGGNGTRQTAGKTQPEEEIIKLDHNEVRALEQLIESLQKLLPAASSLPRAGGRSK